MRRPWIHLEINLIKTATKQTRVQIRQNFFKRNSLIKNLKALTRSTKMSKETLAAQPQKKTTLKKKKVIQASQSQQRKVTGCRKIITGQLGDGVFFSTNSRRMPQHMEINRQ